MGMLMHHTWQKQQEQKKTNAAEEVKKEEIPFTEPAESEPVKPAKKEERKSVPATRRRKTGK